MTFDSESIEKITFLEIISFPYLTILKSFMAQHRQLAVIMFTDIVGYTALMGNDEQKAFEILNKNRNIQKPFIEQYQGRWIKEIGDGVLVDCNI